MTNALSRNARPRGARLAWTAAGDARRGNARGVASLALSAECMRARSRTAGICGETRTDARPCLARSSFSARHAAARIVEPDVELAQLAIRIATPRFDPRELLVRRVDQDRREREAARRVVPFRDQGDVRNGRFTLHQRFGSIDDQRSFVVTNRHVNRGRLREQRGLGMKNDDDLGRRILRARGGGHPHRDAGHECRESASLEQRARKRTASNAASLRRSRRPDVQRIPTSSPSEAAPLPGDPAARRNPA